jgi:hypothetical protein
VFTETQLNQAIVSGATIELGADISLVGAVNIVGITQLSIHNVIDGNGFKIDGGNSNARCFTIRSNSEVSFSDLTVTNCFTVSFQIFFML